MGKLNNFTTMYTFGLIGYPLTHSFSKKYFTDKFQQENIANHQYFNFQLNNIQEFTQLVARDDLKGLNVTIPYKQQVLPYLDQLDKTAQAVGAVNTIKFENGKLIGFNTDVIGFEQSLTPLLQPHHTHALILGTGGAAKGVQYVLKKLGITYKMVSRTPKDKELTYEDIDGNILKKYTLIVNTTPLGMSPNIDTCPSLPYAHFSAQHLCYDLVYNPEVTRFLSLAKNQGACIKNGWEMLVLQAEAAWEIWNK